MIESLREEPFFFACQGEKLLGIMVHPAVAAAVGVLIVVGGPQYRVGSHRQFTLLARRLGQEGFANLRFDYRGMGDSTGTRRSFEDIAPDIRAAIDQLIARVPRVERVVLWGLCDAASAACEYAPGDPRIAGLVLLNPWVRTEAGQAVAYLRHYYVRRLLDPEFWRKVGRGHIAPWRSLGSLCRNIGRAFGLRPPLPAPGDRAVGAVNDASGRKPLPERMSAALGAFPGATLVMLSGNDLTAAEFRHVAASPDWKKALTCRATKMEEIEEADHTFSSAEWRDRVERRTTDWLREAFGV
jgi:exosortase A-associated hydrolase 1